MAEQPSEAYVTKFDSFSNRLFAWNGAGQKLCRLAMTTLDVIICTHNRASELDRALAALATQRGSDCLFWSALVVDNGSTDNTADVVEAWRTGGGIPDLRRVVELKAGLTAAHRRGVRETNGSSIAFVDDDNLLAPDWIHSLAEAICAFQGW
jgi:glycosyltransferase involved in cell wall biosynthesis